LIDPGPPAAVGEGNFWGHPCPGTLFTASADSNALDVVDSFPFANPSAWTFEAPGCADRRACGGGGSLCTLPNGCGGATACTLIGHETGGCLCQPPVFGGGASQTTCTVCGEAGTLTCDLSTCEPVARCTRPEVCNRCDDDGDGQIDNGVPTQGYFRDVDGDGFGAAGSAAIPLACSAVTPGFVLNNTDCNDSNARIHPGTAEVCDNMLDDDCDGAVNEGTPSVTFEVKDQTGATVEGAEVFVDGVSYGTTDSSGILTATNLPCGNLFAFARHRDPKTDEPAYRPNATGWVARYWKTSRVVELDGSVTDHLIFNPNALQTLRLDPKNTMIGWRLTAALDWDATKAELDHIAFIIKEASYDLYNLTDGQFFIEDAEIIDDVDSYGNPGVPWQRAELALSVDSTVHEHATALGGFTGPMNGYNPVIWISPFDEVGGLEASSTYVHELGHLAMGLADEYNVEGFVNPFAQCTAMRTTSHPEFGRGRPRAACVMDDHSVTSKLCSRHNDSSHRHASQQPGPCWDTVASGWKDPAGRTDRWEVVTPDQRNSTKLVGKLERLPAGLDVNPKIVPSVTDPLCDPFPISDPNGAAAAGSPVWVRSRPGATVRRDFTVGKLTESGSMRVRGVHVGDTVLTKLSSGTVTAVAGSPGACVVGF
jgi:hypothetical protein